MNDEYGSFETLELGGANQGEEEWAGEWGGEFEADGEMEEERGRSAGRGMGGGRGMGRGPARGGSGRRLPLQTGGGGGSARPRPGRPPYPRPRPPRGPYWGPVYGGWPYGVMVSDPGPYIAPAHDDPWRTPPGQDSTFEPVDFPSQGGDDNGADELQGEVQQEIPPKVKEAIASLKVTLNFEDAGTLAAVRKAGKLTGAAIYIIAFRKNGQQRAYVGETKDIQKRIRKHMLCGAVLGVPLRNYRIYIAQPEVDADTRRRLEKAINAYMRRPENAGVVTNQRSELEMEVMGPDWT